MRSSSVLESEKEKQLHCFHCSTAEISVSSSSSPFDAVFQINGHLHMGLDKSLLLSAVAMETRKWPDVLETGETLVLPYTKKGLILASHCLPGVLQSAD